MDRSGSVRTASPGASIFPSAASHPGRDLNGVRALASSPGANRAVEPSPKSYTVDVKRPQEKR